MSFDIRLLPEPKAVDASEPPWKLGLIQLGDYREKFVALLGEWDESEYQRQWHDALRRLVLEQKPSCLVTSVTDASASDLVRCWFLYPVGSNVAIQESMLQWSRLPTTFDPRSPYEFVPKHRTETDDGHAISEWELSLRDFEHYLERA